MSVIMGYKKEGKVCLASDNRLTDILSNIFTDDSDKMIVLNEHLAIVCSGSRKAQIIFENAIKKYDTSKWYIEDVVFQLKVMCDYLKITNNEEVNKFGAYFIVGGLKESNKIALYSVSWNHEKFDANEMEELALYPPSDVPMQTCCDIFIPNYHEYFSNCMIKTIQDISALGNMVSKSGDIWVYDEQSGLSEKNHFE